MGGSAGEGQSVRTVLVVEDDVVFRQKVLVPRLAELRCEVVEAGRVREAESLLEHRKADLLIIDGLLPDRTGIDLIRAMRARGDQSPVIFLSAFWRDAATFQMLKGLGVAHVLSKPVDMDSLCRQVATILEAQPAQPSEG